jgi:hypothetical protein
MNEIGRDIQLRCSVLRAMLGNVGPRCAALTCGFNGNVIVLRGYFDDPLLQGDLDDLRLVGTEVIADFGEPYTIEEEIAATSDRFEMLDFWAFIRKGVQLQRVPP